MELQIKKGTDKLLFGMRQKDVEAIYGAPDMTFKDDDKNVIYVYDAQKLRITFYEDEGFRLGYLICANPDLALFGKKVIGRKATDVTSELPPKQFKSWEKEQFDLAVNHFNEDNWLIFQEEFGVIAKVELGAVINGKDELEWAFS